MTCPIVNHCPPAAGALHARFLSLIYPRVQVHALVALRDVRCPV
jgi:hypothetical protein